MNPSFPESDPRLAAWLEAGPTGGPPEVLSSTLARVRTTRQDRDRAGRIPMPTRLQTMSTPIKLAAAAAVALAAGIAIVPNATTVQQGAVVPSASPSSAPSPTPAPLRQSSLPAGDYTVAPFVGDAGAPCGQDEVPCLEAGRDDHIRFTFTVPDGWAGAPLGSDIWLAAEHNSGPSGAGFLIGRGGWLYSDPCVGEFPDVSVGPTMDDFVDALVAHPLLDLTDPVDVTVGGYAGKYLELRGPADRTDCSFFQAWAPTFYAQGDSNLQPIWVIDVDGVRVVIHGSEFPGTAPERSAELRAIVDSMRIDPGPLVRPSTAPVVHGWPGARSNPAGLYSWTPGGRSWMHRAGDAGGSVAMTFQVLDDDEPFLVEIAPPVTELERPRDDRPAQVADVRIQTWLVDAAGNNVFVTVTTDPDTTPSTLAHAVAVIESLRVEETETDPGFRIVFELEDGWDSG